MTVADPQRALPLRALAERAAPSRWAEAALRTAQGDHLGTADMLAAIGARTDEAAARVRAASDFAEAGDDARAAAEAGRAVAFYDEVGATHLAAQARAAAPARSRSGRLRA